MNPSTCTFTTMDTYQGSIFDPTSLHKYLYANANPVMNSDPSGYATLTGTQVAVLGATFIAAAIASNSTWAMNVYKNIRSSFAANSYFVPKYIFQIDDVFVTHIASGLLTSADANDEVSSEITSGATSGTGAASPDPDPNNKKNKKKNDKNYKHYEADEIESKYNLSEGEYHRSIKGKILQRAEQMKNDSGAFKNDIKAYRKFVKFINQCRNPDILISRNGYIALQSTKTKEMVELGITIYEFLREL